MVSFTNSDGGVQSMERMPVISGIGTGAMKKVEENTISSKDLMNGMTDGKAHKRGHPLDSPITDPFLATKRVKVGETAATAVARPAISDAQLASNMFKKFVNTALDERAVGNSRPYQELRRKFIATPADEDAPSSLELRQTISALTHSVSRLDKGCLQLVNDIVNTTWAGRDNLFFKAYLRLLGNLVSAHLNYMPMVTKMLVKHLALQSLRICTLPNHQPVTRKTIYNRTHEALQCIMELVPTAAHSTFLPALIAEFPNKSESRLAHTTYLTNLLRVVEYVPALRGKILAMVIERIIKIDIEVQADIEDLEAEDSDLLHEELRKDDDLEDDESDGSFDLEEEEEEEDETPVQPWQRIKETVEKLDSMMEILFEFCSRYFPGEEESDFHAEPSLETTYIFDHLLESFHKTILPTYQSRYTQFVMFWAVQKSPKFIDIFLGELIGCIIDNNKSHVLRQAAAAYVASFVARARMMDKANVRTSVSYLCSFLDSYLVRRERECSGPDIGKFGNFYSVFQAVMYIFCYRWRDLLLDIEGDEQNMRTGRFIPGLQIMQRAVVSKFNPLKVCSDAVVEQFARIAQFLNLAFCFTIIERNNRSLIGGGNPSANNGSTGSGLGANGGARVNNTTLEAYFPFDPYLLKRSNKWVEGYYVEWQSIPGLDPESDEEEEEEDEDEDEESSEDEEGIEDEDDEDDDDVEDDEENSESESDDSDGEVDK